MLLVVARLNSLTQIIGFLKIAEYHVQHPTLSRPVLIEEGVVRREAATFFDLVVQIALSHTQHLVVASVFLIFQNSKRANLAGVMNFFLLFKTGTLSS